MTRTHTEEACRTFCQAMLSRAIVSEEQCKSLHRDCLDAAQATGDELVDFQGFMNLVNDSLAPLGFTVRGGNDPITGDRIWVFTNEKNDKLAATMTQMQPLHIQFLKRLIDHIVSDENGCISHFDAINVQMEDDIVKKMSKSEAHALVSKFCKEQWLKEVEVDALSGLTLGGRTFVELERYLIDEYNGGEEPMIARCPISKGLLVCGVEMPDDAPRFAGEKVLPYCRARYLAAHKDAQQNQQNQQVAANDGDEADAAHTTTGRAKRRRSTPKRRKRL